MNREEYEHELSVIAGIRRCVTRYALLSSTEDNDNTLSPWYKEYNSYLNDLENKILLKIQNENL